MLTLSPQARAVASITLAFLLVFGDLNRVAYAIAGVFGDSFPSGKNGALLLMVMLGATAGAVLALSATAIRQEGWSGALAQAAVVLSLVQLAWVAFALLAILFHGSSAFDGAFSPIVHLFDPSN